MLEVFSPCAHYIALQLQKRGIKNIVLCPGSRNAPMVDALVSLGTFNLIAETDERNAGFIALGLSTNSATPAAIVCTSGSAVLNVLPALSEAYHQKQCIIAITCDRPTEWIGQQDSQTINHIAPLAPFCSQQAVLQNDDNQSQAWYNAREVDRVFNEMNHQPVHINVPLSDPLYTKVKFDSTAYAKHISSIKSNITATLSAQDLSELQVEIDNANSVVLICGQLSPAEGETLSDVLNFAKNNITVIAENTANYQHDGIRNIDPWVIALQKREHYSEPDIVITIGGHLVSKKIKHFLRGLNHSKIWRIGTDNYYPDTFQHLDKILPLNPSSFLKAVDFKTNKKLEDWEHLYSDIALTPRTEVDEIKLSDLFVYKQISTYTNTLENHHWHYGNSSSIRYAQLFDFNFTSYYSANRGVSGIEGCISTAKGAALANPEIQNILLIGDLAFQYNLNGLNNLPQNLKIILVNNAGGNIFRLIDGPSDVNGFEDFVEGHQVKNHSYAAQHYGIVYLDCHSKLELESSLEKFIATKTTTILEVFTDRMLNKSTLKNHLQYFTDGKQENLEDN